MKANNMLYHFVFWCFSALIMGCMSANNLPVSLGMSKKEIEDKYPFENKYPFQDQIVEVIFTKPGNFERFYRIITKDNIEFRLVFDNNDRLRRISTSDQSYRLFSGIGVGSSFKEIKSNYKNYKTIWMPGYGRCVQVDGNERFCFLMEDKNISVILDDEKIEWIEWIEQSEKW